MFDTSMWRHRTTFFLGVSALVVVLCAAAGTASAQQDGGEASTGEKAGGELGSPHTLDELLEIARKDAPELLEARERVGLGEARIEGASKFQRFNPEIEGEVGVGLGEGGLSKVELKLRQRLEVAGERGLRMDAARSRKRVLEAQVARTRWQVLQNVHRLYRVGLVDRERVEIEQQSLAFTTDLLDIARQRFEAGEEARTSVIVARAERAKARQRLAKARLGYVRTLTNLGVAIGWREDAPPQLSGELRAMQKAPPKQELLELAFEHDPQLAVLDAQLEQTRAELALAERDVWPDPLVGVGYEREDLGAESAENKLLFVLGVSLPVWDRNQGEVAEATTRSELFRRAMTNRKTVIKGRVFEQVEAVQSAYEQAQIYEEEVLPALETQLELLQEGFTLGELSLLDVMNARDRLLGVQREHLEALSEYYTAISELERVIGTPIWSNDNH